MKKYVSVWQASCVSTDFDKKEKNCGSSRRFGSYSSMFVPFNPAWQKKL